MNARILSLLWLLCPVFSVAEERILSFDSDVTINQDASIEVHETITVMAEQQSIRHGIMREFPTRYKDRVGNAVHVGFTLRETRLDGNDVAVKQVEERNGIVLYLGDPDTLVASGKHTYEIRYVTTRQLGFFKDFDELYWNVTGNGWRFPIDAVKATIHLPSGTTKGSVHTSAYTGFFGDQGRDFVSSISGDESHGIQAVFSTTRPLQQTEGLTVAASWPKGIIAEPTQMQKIKWFLKDNIGAEILLLVLAGVFLLYARAWMRVRKSNEPGTIIPLFTPPPNMLPSEVRYLARKKYDAQVLSCEIVNLAVMGYLTIRYESGFFKGTYTLVKTTKDVSTLSPLQQLIMSLLFASGDEHKLATRSDRALIALTQSVRSKLRSTIGSGNFSTNWIPIVVCFIVSALAVALAFALQPEPGLVMVVCIGLLALVNFFFAFRLSAYTKEGRKLMDAIDGFKLFLSTTETERLKVIGTPPTKTPELYEKWLPYAMALDVEEQWSKQFTPVFAALEEQHTPYYPVWYVGPMGTMFRPQQFSQNLSKSFSAAISSSSRAPGSSSGSGGGGSSGGGGGGGGGGGW